jgi:hypothetical protein
MKCKRGILFALLAFFPACVRMQAEAPREMHAPIWVYLETVPGNLDEESLAKKAPPIQELNSLARFVMGGMIYGWKFSYTPGDKTRNVAEYFSLEPVKEISSDDRRFSLTEITPAYPRLNCWAVFTLDDSSKRWESYWSSVLFRSANGKGKADRNEEIAGIRNAYTDAVRDAVRSHARALEKNKPREIRGEVLLRDNPRLYVDQGYFVADIKVLVNIKELIPYTAF